MVNGFWCRKVGMTQVFVEGKVVPVTVIDTNNWFVTNIRTKCFWFLNDIHDVLDEYNRYDDFM